MMTLRILIKRNTKLFFKEKGLFLTSLITPLILLVLYVSFLGNVYVDSLKQAMATLPVSIELSGKVMSGFAGAQLISSILSVSAVTVAFCSNMLMVQDKANKTVLDFGISPVKPHIMAIGYYAATLISTLIVCFVAMAICLVYVAVVGWFFSLSDVILLALDILMLCLFGVALSSVVNFFLSSQGQISAVGSMVSSMYGFVSGAYMPLSQFSEGLRTVLMFLPGTYGTSLLRTHAMRGVIEEMGKEGLPAEFLDSVRDNFDCNLYFFGAKVDVGVMYAVILGSIALLVGAYVLMNVMKGKRRSKA